MIKAIFFDIDGTILSHKTKSVPQSTVKAFDMLRKKGIKIIVASGRDRMEYHNLPVADFSFDAYVMVNGQLCYDENWKLLFADEIKAKDKEVLDRMFAEKKIPVGYVEEGTKYINYVTDNVKVTLDSVSTPLPPIRAASANPVYQVILYIENSEEAEIIKQLPGCKTVRWHKGGTDVIPADGGKTSGIKKYLEKTGIAPEEIMCFGDGENDIDMLRFAKIGVAMGNALDIVKQNADYVTDDIDSDGLYKALKYYEII